MLINGRYQILHPLQEGGFGHTFLAEDTQLPSRRRCVIKQLKPIHNNPEFYKLIQDRFQREAAIQETLGEACQQIPTLYAYFSEGDDFYLVEEWIDGDTLRQQVAATGLFSETTVRELLSQLLPVIETVHQHQIIHRDIKPDNIILRKRDGKPVLIDFGAVKESMATIVNSQGQTAHSIVIGTTGYMAPEQSTGRPVYASDLYSLGLTAIYLLTGKIPAELETNPRSGQIEWRSQAPQVSESLGRVIDTAIQMHPRERYTSAAAMQQALQLSESNDTGKETKIILKTQTRDQGETSFSRWVTPLLVGSGIGGVLLLGYIVLRGQTASVVTQPTPSSSVSISVSVAPSIPISSISPSSLSPSSQPPLTADEYNNQGTKHYHNQEYQLAITAYDKAIDLNPQFASAYYNRGLAKYDLKDYKNALVDYGKAIEFNPKDPDSFNNRGLIYNIFKEYRRAIADYTKAITINPKYALAYANRGNTHYRLKEYQNAILDYTKALELNPKDAETYYLRGNAYDDLNEHENALSDYKKSIEINPKLALAYYNRGITYYNLNNYRSAILDFEKTIEIDPQYADAYYYRGNSYLKSGNRLQGKQDLQTAVKLYQDQGLTDKYNKTTKQIQGL